MRDPAARNAPWRRQAVALAGAAGLIVGSSLVPAAALARPLPPPAAATARAAAAANGSGTTVTGPHMYDPVTKAPFPTASTVTVSQTTNLTNQMVNVSWTGFTPTNGRGVPGYVPAISMYPVMVTECQGTVPTSLASCYGATQGGQYGQFGVYGPYNTVYATTTAQGTGSIPIQVQTSVQNQGLGCDPAHPCSLVIFPIEGGVPIPPTCTKHTADTIWATAALTLGQASEDVCSWPYHIVVPLSFAASPTTCPFRAFDFSVDGSPMLLRAMNSWDAGLCSASKPLSVQYDGTIAEPQARQVFLSGGADVALTTEPATGTGTRPYTYAPVAVSAAAVGYWVDNTGPTTLGTPTGQPFTTLMMNPRLLAKLLTTSYNFNSEGCSATIPPPPVIGCDGAVDGNPNSLFNDPEFQQLNPGVSGAGLGAWQVPTVQSGNSDLTWDVTSWIAANPDATAFMSGTFDPWGMHVNTDYLVQKYPAQAFNALDPYTVVAHQYSPVFPPARVPFYQANNWDPGTQYTPQPNGNGPPTFPANQPEVPGQRALFAIVNEADAAAYEFPTMQLLNHAGKYVAPTAASMAAAVNDMTTNPDGITKSYNENSTDPAGYPLTMVIYAMVPTGGLSKTTAAKIAQWLTFVASPGQAQGASVGQLPAGFLPLPASLRAQTLKAANEVLHQTGAKPPGHTSGGGGTSPGTSSSPAGSKPGAGKGSAVPTTSPSATHSKANAAFSSPDTAGFAKLVLPILLIIGALLALAGPSALVLGRPGGRAAIAAGWRRVTSLGYLPAPLRGRKK